MAGEVTEEDLGVDELVVDLEEGEVTGEAGEAEEGIEEDSEAGADSEQCILNIVGFEYKGF